MVDTSQISLDYRQKKRMQDLTSGLSGHLLEFCLERFAKEYNRSADIEYNGQSMAFINAIYTMSQAVIGLSFMDCNCTDCHYLDGSNCSLQDGEPPTEWATNKAKLCTMWKPERIYILW